MISGHLYTHQHVYALENHGKKNETSVSGLQPEVHPAYGKHNSGIMAWKHESCDFKRNQELITRLKTCQVLSLRHL